MAFVGQLVEIQGASSLRAFDEASQAPSDELVQLTEEEDTPSYSSCGYCSAFLEGYVVRTFGGRLVHVPEERLQLWQPPSAEEGGFDVAWPVDRQGGKVVRFADQVVSALAEKGYCVVQTYMSRGWARFRGG